MIRKKINKFFDNVSKEGWILGYMLNIMWSCILLLDMYMYHA